MQKQELGLCRYCHGQKQHRSRSCNVSCDDGKISITSLQQATVRCPSWNNQRFTPHGHVLRSQLFIHCKNSFCPSNQGRLSSVTRPTESIFLLSAPKTFFTLQLVLTWSERSRSLTKLYYMTDDPHVL